MLPTVLEKISPQNSALIKYTAMLCSVMGIGVLASLLSIHVVIAWICPLLLSSHYYSNKLTVMTLVISLIFMSASIYISMFFGEWDTALIGLTREDAAALIYPGLSIDELWTMLDACHKDQGPYIKTEGRQ